MYKALFQPRKRMTNPVGEEAAEASSTKQGWKPDFGVEEKLAFLA